MTLIFIFHYIKIFCHKHIMSACSPLSSVLWRCRLGGRKGIWPVKNLSGGVLASLSVCSEMQTCIWPSWCHCHSLSLASAKSRLVLPFWYRLTWGVLEKRPLNVCVCVCTHSTQLIRLQWQYHQWQDSRDKPVVPLKRSQHAKNLSRAYEDLKTFVEKNNAWPASVEVLKVND